MGFHIDSFSGPASDLKGAARTPENVLEALRRCPRVSTFDMSENYRWLPDCIQRLKAAGKIVEVESAYPWHVYKVTA